MKKLTLLNIQMLSEVLLGLSTISSNRGSFTLLHALVCAEIKVKVDRKLASGVYSHKGYTIKLSPAQLHVIKLLNQSGYFNSKVEVSNAFSRLIALNQ